VRHGTGRGSHPVLSCRLGTFGDETTVSGYEMGHIPSCVNFLVFLIRKFAKTIASYFFEMEIIFYACTVPVRWVTH
jgi:hypothetical protein